MFRAAKKKIEIRKLPKFRRNTEIPMRSRRKSTDSELAFMVMHDKDRHHTAIFKRGNGESGKRGIGESGETGNRGNGNALRFPIGK